MTNTDNILIGVIIMNENLFRGKSNNKWIIGYYACIDETYHYILTGKFDEFNGAVGYEQYRVIPDTVGQFIGVLDKNKRQIFDGDIVRTKYGRICKVVWFSPQLCWDLYPLECKSKTPDTYDLFKSENLEVIGNIYDNPEILKEGNELYV